jgi:hypothetical protein
LETQPAFRIILGLENALASEYCYSKEMLRALERHRAGEARVIPIILRPCEWQKAPFGSLVAAPADGKAVTKWPDRDDAFLDITQALRRAAEAPSGAADGPTDRFIAAGSPRATTARADGPRSSNLRLTKRFSEHDQDVFLDESFEFLASFFENSLEELKSRNPGHDVMFKRIDANTFSASVYRNGEALSRCQIKLGDHFGKGITYSRGGSDSHGINESMSVETTEQALVLKPSGMPSLDSWSDGKTLSREGGAEYYWALFIQPLQEADNRRRRR